MTWPQNAYVGQKVVCIKGSNWIDPFYAKPLVEGNIYTIKNIIPYGGTCYPTAVVCFGLEEIPSNGKYADIRFRPVQSTETGMKILTEILVTQKVRVDA